MDKQHLLLDWHLDCNTGKLTCELLDGELVYEAHSGGVEGYTKTYKGKVTQLVNKSPDWQQEKYWISENWGERYGYYQPDVDRVGLEESNGQMEGRAEGLGLEGEYIDHLHRSQHLLNGLDMSMINQFNPAVVDSYSPGTAADGTLIKPSLPTFRTPDRGLTIYKLLPTTKTYYYNPEQELFDYENPAMDNDLGFYWQGTCPCQMLPYIKSYLLSDYEEMKLAGISDEAIEKCKAGEWDAPLKPELKKHFTYPTENTHPLTVTNVTNLDNG
jgi:hypothetical protein